ncbi:DUF5317 domain-containing protein [soil metagenome]
MILLYAVIAGLLLGRLAGGRFQELSKVRFEWWQLAVGGLVFQALLFSPAMSGRVGELGPPLYVGSTLVVLAALARNLTLPGFALIGLGALLNLVVIVANGGLMPASPHAFELVTGDAAVPHDDFSNSVLSGPDTRFGFLGDNLAMPRRLPFANVFSVGDILIGLGAAIFLIRAMAGSAAPEARRRPSAATGMAAGGARPSVDSSAAEGS